jgi:hypothetical protein
MRNLLYCILVPCTNLFLDIENYIVEKTLADIKSESKESKEEIMSSKREKSSRSTTKQLLRN